MNNFYMAYHTDIGIRKKTNQDSLLVKGIAKGTEEILFAVLCDGMGGMSKGEVASATVIRAFSEWFTEEYLRKGTDSGADGIQEQWRTLMEQANEKLMGYGREEGISLGTTATAIFISSRGNYLIGHIGDTRVYRISGKLEQLTEDHTFVAREIRRGSLTAEQALKDTRRNILLQCIGVNDYLEPQFVTGSLAKGDAILLCSDGFRHVVAEEELFAHLRPENFGNEPAMKQELVYLTELNKQRQETDNISAIYMKLR